MGWFSDRFRANRTTDDHLARSAAALAERLNSQRAKWLEAVMNEFRGVEEKYVDHHRLTTEKAGIVVSAFQAVHVLSLVSMKNYVPASSMSEFTTFLCVGLTEGHLDDKWKEVVSRCTTFKQKALPEQLAAFSEDVAAALTGSPTGFLFGPGLVPMAH